MTKYEMWTVIEDEDVEQLRNINKALFDDRPMDGDRRRDLANTMAVVLARILKVEVPE